MSLLRTLWGGGEDEKKSSEPKEGEEGTGGDEASRQPAASWVKGFGDFVSSVSDYASNIKETVTTKVQENSFVSEFEAEQKKFEREKRREKDSAVPPWVGFNEEESIKAQILELSADSRNVLRNPPPGIQFHFDFAKSYPVALSLLKEDPRLQKLRFQLVPKKLKEERFWHNYFYRVFLIKQSSQLATLASAEHGDTNSPSGGEEGGVVSPSADLVGESFTDVGTQDTQAQEAEDFASDALVTGQDQEQVPITISKESLRAELDQLGVDSQPGGEEWEEELAKELEGLGEGGVAEGDAELVDDEQWEDELKHMLEAHSTDST